MHQSAGGTGSASFAQAVLARILAFGIDAPDTSCLDLLPVVASAVSTIDAYGSGTFAWAASTGARYTDGVEYLPDIGGIATLAGGDEDGQRQIVSIDA